MNLDENWGEDNVDFDDLQAKGMEFTKVINEELLAQDLGEINSKNNYRKLWNDIVRKKEGRTSPIKKGRYKTRWRRVKNDIDPRLRMDRAF